MKLVKAHAYGNDFLLVDRASVAGVSDLPALARRACERHRGVGADGLVVVEPTEAGAQTALFNQDGSVAEVSGNGVRCVAVWLAHERGLRAGAALTILTAAGPKALSMLEADSARPAFRHRFPGLPWASQKDCACRTLEVGRGSGARRGLARRQSAVRRARSSHRGAASRQLAAVWPSIQPFLRVPTWNWRLSKRPGGFAS